MDTIKLLGIKVKDLLNYEKLPLIVSGIAMIISLLTFCNQNRLKNLTLSQYKEERQIIFSGAIDNNSSIRLNTNNPNIRIQNLVYYFPHELGPYYDRTDYSIIDLKPAISYIRESVYKKHPFGSLLFFAYNNNKIIVINDFDNCISNPKKFRVPIHSGIPVAIKCNYILNGNMYTSVSLYKLYYIFIRSAVPFPWKDKYPDVSDVVCCDKTPNDISVIFEKMIFQEHLRYSDLDSIYNILDNREHNMFQKNADDLSIKLN